MGTGQFSLGLSCAATLALAASGCGALRTPVIARDHPACPDADKGFIPAVPAVLNVERADRRDPALRPSTMLHLDMPTEEHGPHADGQHQQ